MKTLSGLLLTLVLVLSPIVPSAASFAPPLEGVHSPTLAFAPGEMPLTAQELGELKGGGPVGCPDGSSLDIEVYDPNPNDPQAVVYVFRRGSVLVALRQRDSGQDRVYIAATARWIPTAEAAAQYETPCAIPTSGR